MALWASATISNTKIPIRTPTSKITTWQQTSQTTRAPTVLTCSLRTTHNLITLVPWSAITQSCKLVATMCSSIRGVVSKEALVWSSMRLIWRRLQRQTTKTIAFTNKGISQAPNLVSLSSSRIRSAQTKRFQTRILRTNLQFKSNFQPRIEPNFWTSQHLRVPKSQLEGAKA